MIFTNMLWSLITSSFYSNNDSNTWEAISPIKSRKPLVKVILLIFVGLGLTKGGPIDQPLIVTVWS